ncbi:hypothetical protein CVT24_000588 [Panaeolus cyanescens]|uniref:Uncharacterized protein n=1 Tax=Panaeolus cyanescens TaxID=181874 RepID=A0A409YDB5_9AGAR|nr:hypothetical protein CVT24_000588 [Panaeolus cyanescens]
MSGMDRSDKDRDTTLQPLLLPSTPPSPSPPQAPHSHSHSHPPPSSTRVLVLVLGLLTLIHPTPTLLSTTRTTTTTTTTRTLAIIVTTTRASPPTQPAHTPHKHPKRHLGGTEARLRVCLGSGQLFLLIHIPS